MARMITKFSADQIAKLQSEYGKLKAVPPAYLPRFHALLAQCDADALKQLGEAQISFLSPLARNEIARRSAPTAIPSVSRGTGLVKVAWIRNPGAPVGSPAPGHLNCPCGHSPESMFQKGPDIKCACGRVYSWDGWMK